MNKKTGAIMLVAGTCIGSGMIALPMTLATLGIVPSILLMFAIWFVIYFTSLVNLELNLQAGKGLTLGELGSKFSGRIAESIGISSFKILAYALLSVYIYGGASVAQKMLEDAYHYQYSFNHIANLYTLAFVAILLLPMKLLDYINRVLFVGLVIIIFVLVIGLLSIVNWNNLPLFTNSYDDISMWRVIVPVVFTAFGFQVIFHTLTNYCNKDANLLKSAFFWGSLIPSLVYILWTSSVLGAIYQENPTFYQAMINKEIGIGDLIQELSKIAKWPFVQLLIWWVSLLTIVTSLMGVGIGLKQSIQKMLSNIRFNNLISAILTAAPAYIVAVIIPNAFISVLGFAGMILTVIAILLPIYLLYKAKISNFSYPELKYNWMSKISVLVGIVIMFSEIFNMI